MPKPRPFSAKALHQAKLCAETTPSWLQRPTVFGIAIDSAATIEVDDAIWLEPLVPTGAAILSVHIADPTVWIPLDSPLDLEILSRCQTL
jgi:exoribonuclease R